ncbi:hypothetical protein BD413DRAFT_104394 [Trametes elegans]|nr:hypothetical protein BD413DRAFT_104394 [Trametes elegans]
MWTNGWGLLSTLILLWPLQAYAANFTFSYGAATQCDDFSISWKGGTAPFQLTFAPAYGTPSTLNIPADNYKNGQGSFTTTLPYAKDQQVLAIMSDSTGFASGGVSDVLIVGKSSGKKSCNTTIPTVDFYYDTPLALTQCRSYSFSGYDEAVQPITIYGVVPAGSSFILNPPRGSATFDWNANVKAGTSLLFMMVDSRGRQGGSTQVNLVGMSDDATCLAKNSPASVTNAPSQTTSAQSKPTGSKTQSGTSTTASDSASSTTNPDSSGASGKTSGGTVAAAVIACLVAAFIVGTLVWWYLRRRRGGGSVFKGKLFGKFQKKEIDLMHDPSGSGLPSARVSPYPLYHNEDIPVSTPNSTADLLGRPSADPYGAASAYGPATTILAHPPGSAVGSQFPPPVHRGSLYDGPGHGGRPDEGSIGSWDQTITSGMRRKAAAAGVSPYAPSARFILHTDIDDDPPPPPDDEVIELPPQYSERRAPGQPPSAPTSPTAAAGSSGASGSGAGARYGRTSDLPRPPSGAAPSTSPGLAYLTDGPSEHGPRLS